MNNFKNEEAKVRRAIASFFGVHEFQNPQDLTGVWVQTIIDEMALCGMMLAGGAITSTFSDRKINDLDFYVKSPHHQEAADGFIKRYFQVSHTSTNAITYKRKSDKSNKVWTIQLITRFKGSPIEIMDWFDFTITQGVYDPADSSFHFGERFLADVARRKLVYLGKSKYPICAMHRTKKYQARGYDCPGSTIMHIALSIVQLEITTYRELKDQLMGIDTMYLQNLLENKDDETPVDYAQFITEAFARIDGFRQEDEDEEALDPKTSLWVDVSTRS